MRTSFNFIQYKGILKSEPVKTKTSEPPIVGSVLTEPDLKMSIIIEKIKAKKKNDTLY